MSKKNKSIVILSCVVMLIICWAAGLFWFIQSIPSQIEDNLTETDAIVVLTGGQKRIIEGINLLALNKAKKLLITGVGKHTNIDEIKLLSDELKSLAPRINLGYMAIDTKGNAQETSLWMELNHFNSIRLVTANYHMIRSYAEFKSMMPYKQIIKHPVFPDDFVQDRWWRSPVAARLIVSEYNKFLVYSFVNLASLLKAR